MNWELKKESEVPLAVAKEQQLMWPHLLLFPLRVLAKNASKTWQQRRKQKHLEIRNERWDEIWDTIWDEMRYNMR